MKFPQKKLNNIFGYLLLIAAIVILFWLLGAVFTVIVLAMTTAYFAMPIYTRLQKKTPGRLAMILTWIIIIAVILIPIVFLLGVVGEELTTLINDLTSAFNQQDIDAYGIIDRINSILQGLAFTDYQLEISSIQEKIGETAQRLITQLSSMTATIGSSTIKFITNTILYIFTVTGLISHRKILGDYIKDLLPLSSETFELYRTNLSSMGASMIKATIIIAMVQAIITGISLRAVGLPYIALWSVLAFLLSVIPLIGSSFVVFPLAIVLIIIGQPRAAVIIILINQFITNNIDNILRPKLVNKDAKINETLLLLSVIGGMSLFGLLGVIYGPVLMSFVLVTFDVYKHHRKK